MRRLLIILAVVIVIAGIGVAAYFYFFGSSTIVVAPEESAGLPVAGQGTFPTPGEGAGQGEGVDAAIPVSARLVKVSAGPVARGEVVANTPGNASTSPDTVVSYIERASGNIFTYSLRTQTITRTSNRTLPGIQSAAWLPDASFAFVRYLSGEGFSTINTYALPADGSLSKGFFLPQNLADIAVSPSSLLLLASGADGSTASLTHADGSRASEIFSTPLSSLRISFAGKDSYLAYTKPSSTLSGNAFLVDSVGRFSRIAGPRDGLAALASPSGAWALVSYTLDGEMQMELVNTATGEELPLPVATIADKCAWAADDSAVYCGIPMDPPAGVAYPDDWYQGALRFSDRIWKIQVAGRYAQLVLDFNKETGEDLDAEALALDPLLTALVFINRNDDSLWSYSL